MVTDGHSSWGAGFSRRQESGTFFHELGHTLNLHHGGANPGIDERYKPNYESIMNYSWQLQGSVGPTGIDYSRAALPTLDENALSEAAGLTTPNGIVRYKCPNGSQRDAASGANVDWNCNGAISASTVVANINGEGGQTMLGGANDWANVKFDGGTVGAFGAGDLDDQQPPPTSTINDEPTATDYRTNQVFGSPGDGSIGFVGPATLLLGITGQAVELQVDNIGNVEATYQLAVAGAGSGIAGATRTVTVPANSSLASTYPSTRQPSPRARSRSWQRSTPGRAPCWQLAKVHWTWSTRAPSIRARWRRSCRLSLETSPASIPR